MRGVAFFALLGVVAGSVLATFAGKIAVAGVFSSHAAGAAVLIRYAALAFLLTNLTMSVASTLQGLNRVDTAYRAQTLGWMLYVPTLLLATKLFGGVHGTGIAWVAAYSVQLALLLPPCVSGLRALPPGGMPGPRLRDMISLGGRWQISSWADFATFQLPRILGAFVLTSSTVVDLDLALRFGQAAVAPFLAVLPILLPAFSRISVQEGLAGLRAALERWYYDGLAVLLLTTAVLLPLTLPAIAVWAGRSLDEVDAVVATAMLLGMVAHASTGVFSNAWLAVGTLRPVIVYKTGQLGAAVALVPVGALLGTRPLALGLAVSLAAPAVLFNRSSVKWFQLPPREHARSASRVAAAALAGLGGTLATTVGLALAGTVAVALVGGTAVAGLLWIAGMRFCGIAPSSWRAVRSSPPPVQART